MIQLLPGSAFKARWNILTEESDGLLWDSHMV